MDNLERITSIVANCLSILVSAVAIWHIRAFLKATARKAIEDAQKIVEKI
jgi:hypothetical protein